MDLTDALKVAQRAVIFDQNGNFSAAAYYYSEAARLLTELGGDSPHHLQKAQEYSSRSSVLSEIVSHKDVEKKSASTNLGLAGFLLAEGLAYDEKGQTSEAVECYSSAVELCLKAKSETEDPVLKSKLRKIASEALNRAELLKCGEVQEKKEESPTGQKLVVPPPPPPPPPLGYNFLKDEDQKKKKSDDDNGKGYSAEEKRVLATTSIINGREYVPFLEFDLKERFAFPVPFTDKSGYLSLSPKQKSLLVRWARPEEFAPDPKAIELVDCYSVKQTVVSDCSFVASIAIAAQYEKRFGKRLITSIIYPQNRKGEPVYNPCGKYMIKLRINGVARKVIIDDYFPVGKGNELLCSYSSNRNELWISLLEKAYMKVMGGYNFPGSNSNIDLYALTGWIPERISLRSGPGFNKALIFKKIFERFHRGHLLVTMATGEMSNSEADRTGLVSTHAYAMLDVKEALGVKLFLLKNPWSHLRWRGNYSELDTRNWSPLMKKALEYDPESASNFDNGVFWIDYDSLIQFFDVAYLNWNPELFKYSYSIHQSWNAGVGPTKDMYDLSSNPQYSLEIKDGNSTGALWILLSRHITDIDDFENNKEYITVLVYKNEGKRVYYPMDPPPYIDGIRINSPHYLCQTVIKDGGPRKFTLVVSQFEKTTTIYYTIRVLSSLPFTLKKIGNPYEYKREITGEWNGKTAGGCLNFRETHLNNPRYQITLTHDSHVLIELKGPKQFQIGFDIFTVICNDEASPKYFRIKQSGLYRSGFVVLALEMLSGTYDIVPSTFRPGHESPFFLTVQSSSPFKFGKVT